MTELLCEITGLCLLQIEASTRTHIAETRHAHLDQLHDNAVTIDHPPPMDKHPHIPPGNALRRSASVTEGRDIFACRKVDEDLIHRHPADDLNHRPPPPTHPPPHGGPPTGPHLPHGYFCAKFRSFRSVRSRGRRHQGSSFI